MRIITWVRKERAMDELQGTERAVDKSSAWSLCLGGGTVGSSQGARTALKSS